MFEKVVYGFLCLLNRFFIHLNPNLVAVQRLLNHRRKLFFHFFRVP